MIKPNNPFLVSEYLSPEYFCDRKQETEELLRNLYNGWSVTLVAPRRIGKTGLIKNAFHQLASSHPEIHTYYIDIMGTQSLTDLVALLGKAILGSLDSDLQKALKHVSDFVHSCHPTLTFDERSGVPQFSLNVDPVRQEDTLTEIFDYLKSSEQPCYIAIDEFQRIADYPEKGTEALLRSQIQFLPNVKFIFSGSKRHMLEQMFLGNNRPFYRSTRMMMLDVIPEPAYYAFASSFFTQQGRTLSQEVFNKLYGSVHGHTWYVQSLLKELYSYYQPIDVALLETAFQSLIRDNSSYYEVIFDSYTPTLRRLLKAIASERLVKKANGSDFITKYSLKAASTVSSAMKSLEEDDVVYRQSDGYRLYDPFFEVWLRTL